MGLGFVKLETQNLMNMGLMQGQVLRFKFYIALSSSFHHEHVNGGSFV
jgi:hypothetical protein